MKTVYLYPLRAPQFSSEYARLTGFTEEEIAEKCREATDRGHFPTFEADISEEDYAMLMDPNNEIPWTHKLKSTS